MKKIIWVIITLFILTGCMQKVEIEGKITEIKYNDTIILKEDYDSIKNLLSTSFSAKKRDNLTNNLTIKTEKNMYNYTVSDEYIGYNDNYAQNKKIGPFLKKLQAKYNNSDFYKIKYEKNLELNPNNTNILLDKTSNYIVINLEEKIKNFKINVIESQDGKHKDIDLLYSKESLNKGTIVIRKSISFRHPDIRISFENPYNYTISIIPTYDENSEEINFDTTYKAKENS